MNPFCRIFSDQLKVLLRLLSIVLILLTSCGTDKKIKYQPEISPQEREWLTPFFTDIMLHENGVYTLWGSSKPITIIAVDLHSEEEIQAFYDSISAEEMKDCVMTDASNLKETWGKWEQINHRFPMQRYKLFKTDLFQDDKAFFILFVDVIKTAAIIQDNYEAFRKIVEFDFHPLEIALEVDQKGSKFWEKIGGNRGNSYLLGLLFGFGKFNSQIFHWKYYDHPESCEKFCDDIKRSFNNKHKKGYVKFSINNFEIPNFASFNDFDNVIELYQNEKLKIQHVYKGEDFLDLTLEKLTGNFMG